MLQNLCQHHAARLLFVLVVLGIVLLPSSAHEAQAQLPPNRFWGSASIDGSPAPAGTEIRGYIGSAHCGSASVQDGNYVLDIAHDATVAGCGTAGATVTFRIGDLRATQSAPFIMGGGTPLNLSASRPAAAPPPPPMPPSTPRTTAAPSDLTATASDTSSIVLTWSYPSPSVGFQIERGSNYLVQLPAGTFSYTARELGPDREYCFRIRTTPPNPSEWSSPACARTPQPSDTTTAVKPVRTVIVFVQGHLSSLTDGNEPHVSGFGCPVSPNVGDGPFACIKQALTLAPYNYDTSDFLEYSFNGGSVINRRWVPNDYTCHDVVNPAATNSANVLHRMLSDYSAAHPELEIHFTILGHSLGGYIAFKHLSLQRSVGSLPYHIDNLVTLDSPLGGTLLDATLASQLVRSSDNQAVLDTLNTFKLYDEAELLECLTGNPTLELAAIAADDRTTQNNIDTVEWAKQQGIVVHTIGNENDGLYQMVRLPDGQRDEIATQVIEGASGRLFNLGRSGFVPAGHMNILSEQTAIEWILQHAIVPQRPTQ